MEIEKNDPSKTREIVSVILAGGEGTRLFPLTKGRAKPSVSFGGGYRLIDIPLSNSLNSQIEKIFVISQRFGKQLEKHIHSAHRDITVLSPKKEETGVKLFKGTADAVRQNLPDLLSTNADYFLILSGDQLYNLDFRAMLLFAKEKDAGLTIATLPVKEREAKRMGVMKINLERSITDFVEKPQNPEILQEFLMPGAKEPLYLASMGIYIFKRETLKELLEEKGNDFGKDLIPKQVAKGDTAAYVYDGYWEDIGTISSFFEANLALTQADHIPRLNMRDENNPIVTTSHHLPSPMIYNTAITNSLIGGGSIIKAASIFHSIIGLRTHIKQGSHLKNCVVIGNHFHKGEKNDLEKLHNSYYIGENCYLENVIVDEKVCIGNNVQLVNKGKLESYDGDGIYIRDGIIIVTTGAVIPDNFIL